MTSVRSHLRQGRIKCFGTTTTQGDRHAKARRLDSERASYARARARDQRALAVKLHGS